MTFRTTAAVSLTLPILAAGVGPAAADQPQVEESAEFTEAERNHWSFHPVSTLDVPRFEESSDRQWADSPIDAFILAKLKDASLDPSPPADRATLIRRLTFDLTGLPPTPKDVAAFQADDRPDAVGRLVDRLLASPRYGERWGQHWLDVVRFAESEGFEYDRHLAGAWMYRDYVIHAFNADKPYDHFVIEQIAGDELAEDVEVVIAEEPLLESPEQAGRIAAGFHRLGPVRRNAGNAEVAFSRNEVLTERTDVIGLAFLGLTVGCARCHDHMFDAIRQSDYYRLQAYLAQTYARDLPLTDAETYRRWQAQTDSVQERIGQLKDRLSQAGGAEEERLREQINELKQQLPEPLPTMFSVGNQSENRTVIRLLDRGDETSPGQTLGMRPLGVLVADDAPELDPALEKPKLRLARWITRPDHPLTARVLVNRVWQYHFGRGIVSTPNDFGINGQPPSHPELLDWLTGEFVRSGWSLKSLHRLILRSRVYGQSSRSDSEAPGLEIDPQNKLLWRFSRRRLSAEEIRDALLAVTGRLNQSIGGESVMVPVDGDLVGLLYDPEQWQVTSSSAEHRRRTIYLIAKRNLRLPFLEVFDQPDLQISCACREQSTHAPQALELVNGELANSLADSFAAGLTKAAGDDVDRLIELAFRQVTGRPPSRAQKALAARFVEEQPLREFALAMFNLNAFLYVE